LEDVGDRGGAEALLVDPLLPGLDWASNWLTFSVSPAASAFLWSSINCMIWRLNGSEAT
jgi:hypothetical protein